MDSKFGYALMAVCLLLGMFLGAYIDRTYIRQPISETSSSDSVRVVIKEVNIDSLRATIEPIVKTKIVFKDKVITKYVRSSVNVDSLRLAIKAEIADGQKFVATADTSLEQHGNLHVEFYNELNPYFKIHLSPFELTQPTQKTVLIKTVYQQAPWYRNKWFYAAAGVTAIALYKQR